MSHDDQVIMSGVTMELPWKDNQKDISCIPVGTYPVELFHSIKFGKCFKIQGVPGRDAILIHKGNYNRDTHGCILPGKDFADLDKDGNQDITASGATVDLLVKYFEMYKCDKGILEIV